MPYSTYQTLPLESLYELLVVSVRDLLSALDLKEDREIVVKGLRKQTEVLLQLILEKRSAVGTGSTV